LRVELAGEVAIEHDGRRFPLRGVQTALVLAYLVAHRNRAVSRDELAELLWPGARPPHWAGAVRGVVSRLRHQLERSTPGATVDSSGGHVQLHLPVEARVDVEEAAADVDLAEASWSDGAHELAAARSRSAVGTLSSPFLVATDPGIEAPWITQERRRLATLHARACRVLGEASLAAGHPNEALLAAQQLIDADPDDQAGHRLLMRAAAEAHGRPAALAAYEKLRRTLADDLGIQPAPSTQALYVELLGAAPAPGTWSPPRAPRGPFVGRDDELATLEKAWRAASTTATAQLVVLEGEPGAGKTRLAAELAARVAMQGHTVLWGQCGDGSQLPYEPVFEALAPALHGRPEVIAALGPAANDLSPLFPDLLDGAGTDARTDAGVSTDLGFERTRLFRSVATALRHVASVPTVWVVDDVQWATVDTLALIGHLLRAATDRPLLTIVTTRPDGAAGASALAAWQRGLDGDTVELAGLSVADVAELVRHEARASGRSDRFAHDLHARTAGNPFFVTELLRAESGPDAAASGAVPDRLRRWISARCDALPADETATLELAAVIGTEIDVELLRRCTDVAAADLDRVVGDLVVRRFLADGADADELRFTHAVVRDAVYGGIPASRRAGLHRAVGAALEGTEHGREHPAALAHHFERAGREAAAVAHTHLIAAGDAAMAQAAWQGAADHFRAAARLAPGPDGRAHALIALGRAERGSGDRAAAQAAAEEARALALEHGLVRRLAEATLALVGGGGRGVAVELPDAERAVLLRQALAGLDDEADTDLIQPLLSELALALLLTDHVQERRELADRGVALAEELGHPSHIAAALVARRIILIGPEHAEQRLVEVGRVLALPRSKRDAGVTIAALLAQHEDLLLTGARAAAKAALTEASAMAARFEHPYWEWAAATWSALDAVIDGRLDDAEALAFAAIGHQPDHPESTACLGVNLVDIRLYQRRAGEMAGLLADAAAANPHIPCYRAVLALCQADAANLQAAGEIYSSFADAAFATPDDTNRLLTLVALAHVAAAIGDVAGARLLAAQLHPHRDRHVVLNCFGGGGAYWGTVSHASGRLAALDARHDDALELLTHAVAAAASFGAPLAAGRASADLAVLTAT
jgi:DNA-binding SARP family transcriptional activator/tetratricopeptide (TPR) repeat protein